MRRIAFVLIFISAGIKAQEITNLNLFDCYKMARENHPYFHDRQRLTDNSQLKVNNANIQWYPQLTGNAQATYQSDAIKLDMKLPIVEAGKIVGFSDKNIETSRDQYKLTLDVNQMLYDGGSIRAQKKIAESSLEADLQQNEAELHKVNEQVNQVYFTLLIIKENKKLLE